MVAGFLKVLLFIPAEKVCMPQSWGWVPGKLADSDDKTFFSVAFLDSTLSTVEIIYGLRFLFKT